MIRPYAYILLASLVAVVLQTTLNDHLFQGRLNTDLILVMVVLLGLFRDPVHGALMAFLLGGIQDYFSGQALDGLFLFSLTLIFILANLFRRRFSALSPGAQFVFVLGFGVADKVLLYLLLLLFAAPGVASAAGWPFWILEVFINAALAPLLYQLMSRVPNLLPAGATRP
ncbi:MAG: rod shape-determining protein MreD [Deltaproteobacteria bacterium RBG_13_61_14]|nr:MAG: rod shape-determining protein MreD [Deltaproteobacteria bacterium RBG_13_61_14]